MGDGERRDEREEVCAEGWPLSVTVEKECTKGRASREERVTGGAVEMGG